PACAVLHLLHCGPAYSFLLWPVASTLRGCHFGHHRVVLFLPPRGSFEVSPHAAIALLAFLQSRFSLSRWWPHCTPQSERFGLKNSKPNYSQRSYTTGPPTY